MRSSELCKSVLHETFQILPLRDDKSLDDDRRRSGQTYPGALSSDWWTIMQSPSTKDGSLCNI